MNDRELFESLLNGEKVISEKGDIHYLGRDGYIKDINDKRWGVFFGCYEKDGGFARWEIYRNKQEEND